MSDAAPADNALSEDNVLEIRDLAVDFKTDTGLTHALVNVGFDVPRGKVTAVVGESGSGKSVTANCIMRLVQPPGRIIGGTINFTPTDMPPFEIVSLRKKDPRLQELRGGHISMVFQEPMTALSPVYTVGNQVAEAILCHRKVTRKEAMREAAEMLERVGIGEMDRRIKMYPFEFSGGMRQRVVIAMALVCHPEILICDEPTVGLAPIIAKEVYDTIERLKADGLTILLVDQNVREAIRVGDHVYVLEVGQNKVSGTKSEFETNLHDMIKDWLQI